MWHSIGFKLTIDRLQCRLWFWYNQCWVSHLLLYLQHLAYWGEVDEFEILELDQELISELLRDLEQVVKRVNGVRLKD